MTRRAIACWIAVALFASCCSFVFDASIYVRRSDATSPFTEQDEQKAKAIVAEICRRAGFWETDAAEKLSAPATSWPYRYFVSLGAPGSSAEQRSITILGEMRKDRGEIRVSVGDDSRGEPLPRTRELIDELRVALERAFPDSRVEVVMRRTRRGFAP